MKSEKTIWVYLFQKYGKFWSVSLDNFIKHKPFISEECKKKNSTLATTSFRKKKKGIAKAV